MQIFKVLELPLSRCLLSHNRKVIRLAHSQRIETNPGSLTPLKRTSFSRVSMIGLRRGLDASSSLDAAQDSPTRRIRTEYVTRSPRHSGRTRQWQVTDSTTSSARQIRRLTIMSRTSGPKILTTHTVCSLSSTSRSWMMADSGA